MAGRIAVEALGAEAGTDEVARALGTVVDSTDATLLLVGPRAQSEAMCAGVLDAAVAAGRIEIIDAEPTVRAEHDPLASLVDERRAAPWVAATLVKNAEADAAIFVGHTGAAVAASALALGRMPGVSRPALGVQLPSVHGPVFLADTGAFADATPEQLADVALLMGACAMSAGVLEPRVGLLSIGAESGKGDLLRKASEGLVDSACTSAGWQFVGLVEGHDLALGDRANVVVTDGFTGNVALKSMEGALAWATHTAQLSKDAFRGRAAWGSAGALVMGVQGVSVVTHAASRASDIASAVRLAVETSYESLAHHTRTTLERVRQSRSSSFAHPRDGV